MKVSPSGLLLLLIGVPIASSAEISTSNRATSSQTYQTQRSTFLVTKKENNALSASELILSLSRGGELDDESEYDYEDEEEEEEEEDEEEEELQASLSKATMAKVKKNKTEKIAKATSKSKAAINASLQKTKNKKKSTGSILKRLGIPYIVRACMNPLTVLSMTKAYFASLFNIGFLEEEASDGLRSALEAKAKREAAAGVNTSGAPKGKKKKAGRTKSLADLPALSA